MSRLAYWDQFSRKVKEKIDRLRFVGSLSHQMAEERSLRYVLAEEKSAAGKIALYWLVDETDGVIADAKFHAVGSIGLIAAAETASEMVLRKTYDQASRISADLLDQHMRDKKETPAFPKECYSHLNLVLSAIDRAVQQCLDIPFMATHDVTPIEYDLQPIPGGIPGFLEMPQENKLRIIEEVIDKEIRPYVELDAGGVKIVSLQQQEVTIAYEGSCTSCHSSTGSTLTAIQQILRARVHPALSVIPQL
jgi:NifU-like protein